jgi:NSS family neurotransmitter:Na+ symporter
MDYLLAFRPEQVSFASIRLALTHAFYTLALGMGVLVVYGAYSAPDTPLKRSAFAVALMGTLIAIIAGVVIYAIVFSSGGVALEGFPLVFLALPESLSQMPGGHFVTTVFFATLVLAAWSSSIALLEPAIAWLQERVVSPRTLSALLVGICAWALGLVSLYSFNIWSDYTLLGATAYRWLELVTSTLIIPMASILLGFFVGWALPDETAHQLFGRGPDWVRHVWQWVIRLVLPAVILYTGIHYAMEAGSSLCGVGESAFWCDQPAGAGI